MIAGCIAAYPIEGDLVPPDVCVANFEELDPITIDDGIGDGLSPYYMLKDETLLHILIEYFSEVDQIAYTSHAVTVGSERISLTDIELAKVERWFLFQQPIS